MNCLTCDKQVKRLGSKFCSQRCYWDSMIGKTPDFWKDPIKVKAIKEKIGRINSILMSEYYKTHSVSQETRDKKSHTLKTSEKAQLAYKNPERYKKLVATRRANDSYKVTQETLAKIKKSKEGKRYPWSDGRKKSYKEKMEIKYKDPIFLEKFSAIQKRWAGTPQNRERVSNQSKELWNNEREKMLEALGNGRKNFGTDIEIKLEEFLSLLGIKYEKQIRVGMISVSDFYLPDFNLYVFCDGDYWHNRPGAREKDERQNKEMSEQGYKFIRFWGKEIMKDSERVVEKLLSYQKNGR